MSFYSIDIVQSCIDKTKKFFSGPDLKSKWLKIGILVFIYSILSGGGGGGSGFSSGSESGSGVGNIENQIQNLINSITPEMWTMIFIGGALVFLFLVILGIILTLIRNMTFFSILESIETNSIGILSYFKKFYSKAISLTIFELIVGLLMIPLMLGFTTLVIGGIFLGFGFDASILGPIAFIVSLPLLIILGLFVFVLAFVFGIITFIINQFARYWMYKKEMSAFEAFKKSFSLALSNVIEIIVMIIVKAVLGVGSLIITIIVAIGIGIPFAIIGAIFAVIAIIFIAGAPILLVPAILLAIIGLFLYVLVLTIALAPIQVFFFYYDLAFLEKLLK